MYECCFRLLHFHKKNCKKWKLLYVTMKLKYCDIFRTILSPTIFDLVFFVYLIPPQNVHDVSVSLSLFTCQPKFFHNYASFMWLIILKFWHKDPLYKDSKYPCPLYRKCIFCICAVCGTIIFKAILIEQTSLNFFKNVSPVSQFYCSVLTHCEFWIFVAKIYKS